MNERTRMIAAMSIAAIIIFSWVPLMRLVEKQTGWQLLPKPEIAATQPADDATTQATTQSATQPTTITAGQGGVIALPSTRPGELSLTQPTTTQPAVISLGAADRGDKTYAMQMRVTPFGAGIDQVTLNDFTARVGSNDPFSFDFPYTPTYEALGTRSVTINGVVKDLSSGVWRIDQQDANSVRLSIDLSDGSKPLLTLVKRFVVLPRDDGGGQGPQGFDTTLQCQFINRSARPLTVSSELTGPTFPPSEQLRGGDRQVIAGYQGKNAVVLRHDTLEGFTGSSTTKDYTTYEDQPLLWIGASGNYFNGIVRPEGANWIKTASATALDPAADAHVRQVAIAINTNDFQLAPGASQTIVAKVFFGPRQRALLKNPYYSAPGIGYQHALESTSSCAWCTFSWLVDFLMWLLGIFHAVLRDWGLSIIALVFLVRALLHPITKRSQVTMASMGKMGPELERIKKKYANDKEALNRAMMEFYKTQGATPILGCLPMLLQMPIWIALYSGLSSTFELRQQGFLPAITWIKDLSQPDHLIKFSQPFSLFGFLHFDGINIIPILMGVAYFLQQKLTPKPMASSPEQQQQQKMMQWMTLLFPLMLYSSPSGLNLYIFTSTVFGIIESRIVRKHIAEQEALAKAGPTIVDADVIDARTVPEPKKSGGIMGWFTQLQEKAEQMRNDAEKQPRTKRK